MRKVGDAVTYVIIYVDDIVIASNDDRTVAALKATLKKKYRITDAGRLENFLGLAENKQEFGEENNSCFAVSIYQRCAYQVWI